MKTTQTLNILMLAVVVLAAIGGCESKESEQGQANSQQYKAAKPLGIPKELTLDLGDEVTLKLTLIPAGKFQMGSPKTETARAADEGPQREVTISNPFYMGVYEVTQGQWRTVMATEPWDGHPWAKSGAANAASRISWDNAGQSHLKTVRCDKA